MPTSSNTANVPIKPVVKKSRKDLKDDGSKPADNYDDDEKRRQIEEMVQIFGGGLQTLFNTQAGLKQEIEQRWLDDLRHYNGVYDKDTQAKLDDNKKGSRIFVNLTRSKCNTAESKWSDLVLPTDDRNWGIKPTPVPSLVEALTNEKVLQLVDGTTPTDPDTGEVYTEKDLAEETMKAATKAAKLMEDEINDQLTEAGYNGVCRDVIHNAVVMGTGIIKGPMVEHRAKKAWVKQEVKQDGSDQVKQDGSNQWVLSTHEEYKPTAGDVDPWNFFPDMAATRWEDCEFTFERHMMIKKDLIKLAKQPGFLTAQVARVLLTEPSVSSGANLSYLNELREINGITQIQFDNRYEVLEYHGPIKKEDLIACGCKGINMEDTLEEYEGLVWICNGIVMKVGLNHMDTDELPYNLLCWEKDDTNVFGFGVPYRMRSPQKVMNASWRMVLDNAALSTGPQILINKSLVEPADGVWELSPRKIWWLTSKDPKFRADFAMQTFNIDSHQVELTAIFEMAHRLADEETSVPQMQMGNQPGDTQQPAMLKTLGGTALWMSANNIMMRRAGKSFDDDITSPFITRFYDWNMQFNQKAEIKGDYSVDARGTSVLLVREMQARNIMEFINAALSLPGGPEELITRGVLKNMAKGMQVAVDDVMRSDTASELAIQEAKDNPPMDPIMQEIQAKKELKQMEIDGNMQRFQMESQVKMTLLEGERQIALISREVELTKLAATGQVNLEKIRQESGIKKYEIDWQIKAFYEEMFIKEKEGQTANYGLEAGK